MNKRRSIYDANGRLRSDVCWGCGHPATTTNAAWPVCAYCKTENVGVNVQGATRSLARQQKARAMMSTCPGGLYCPWDKYDDEHHSVFECGHPLAAEHARDEYALRAGYEACWKRQDRTSGVAHCRKPKDHAGACAYF